MKPIDVYIGYDPTESAAYHVLAHSIIRNSSYPVSITPVRRSHLNEWHKRPRGKTESTQFSMTRFLVPFLAGYRDWAIFMDCDMLCRGDISELMDLREGCYAVQVAKHDYTPKSDKKMLGNVQTKYEKKNWSSVMLMNTKRCMQLTPEYVNRASGLDLHQFKWLDTDLDIGPIPTEWNWLVGEYEHNPDARLVHYTLGGPWWKDYQVSDYADEWRDELHSMLSEVDTGEASPALKRGG